jgi:hypothetical protein
MDFQRKLGTGAPPPVALRLALAEPLRELLIAEVARQLGHVMPRLGAGVNGPGLGLGIAPPVGTPASEADDITIHNIPPTKKEQAAWEERQYRGLWYPAFMTPIRDLTSDDVGLAAAFLAGKLTQKGCPQSDAARKKQEKENLAWRIFHGIQMVAGIVASTVMTVIYGPLAGAATNLMHRAKMALVDRFWREKIIQDPAVRLVVEKLAPVGPFTYRGFRYWMRPLGNMLVKELGCGADLPTRLLLHGRMLRMLDVLCASAPTAKSRPGLYDYPSSFGMLRGSIFPPRGPMHDGEPPPAAVQKQAEVLMQTPVMREAVRSPAVTLTRTAESFGAPKGPPPEVTESAAAVRAQIEDDQRREAAEMTAQRKRSPLIVPALVAGGVLLGTLALARAARA